MKYYKYENCRKADGSFNPHLSGVLAEGDLFFSKPSTFEDQEDCKTDVYLKGSNSEIIELLYEMMEEDPRNRIDITENGWLQEPQSYAEFFNIIAPSLKSQDILGVFCLSKKWNSKEMWEYYANSQGICFGYEVAEHSENKYGIETIEYLDYKSVNILMNFIPFMDVLYMSTGRPKVNRVPTANFMKALQKSILIKDSTRWKFENEVRSFIFKSLIGKPLGENGTAIHCNPDIISEIIFSPTTNEKTIRKIKDIISQRPSGGANVHYYRISNDYLEKTEL